MSDCDFLEQFVERFREDDGVPFALSLTDPVQVLTAIETVLLAIGFVGAIPSPSTLPVPELQRLSQDSGYRTRVQTQVRTLQRCSPINYDRFGHGSRDASFVEQAMNSNGQLWSTELQAIEFQRAFLITPLNPGGVFFDHGRRQRNFLDRWVSGYKALVGCFQESVEDATFCHDVETVKRCRVPVVKKVCVDRLDETPPLV